MSRQNQTVAAIRNYAAKNKKVVSIVAVCAVFVLIGLIGVARSRAATFAVAIEAESGTVNGNAAKSLNTTGASNKSAVTFSSNGTTPTPTPTPPTPTPPTPTPPTPTPPTPTPVPSGSSIYLSPNNGSYTVGSQITVAVNVNSQSTLVNTAQADLSYSSNLQYVSTDISGTAYGGGCPSNTGGSGTVNLACFVSVSGTTANNLSGDHQLAKVTFKVLAAGTGTIKVEDSSQALTVADSSNIITTRQGGSFTLK